MDIKSLIEYDQIYHGDNVPGRDELLRMSDKVEAKGGHLLFSGFNGDLDRIKALAGDLKQMMIATIRKAVFVECEGKEKGAGTFRRRISGQDGQKLMEVTAIGLTSGAIQNSDDIYIIDACGGIGILSTSISALRGAHSRTMAECVDIDMERSTRHRLLRASLGTRNPYLKQVITDFRHFTPTEHIGYKTYCLAKHPCGTATDIVLQRLTELKWGNEFPDTTIMTCCHQTASSFYPFSKTIRDDHIFVNESDWLALTSMAHWVDSEFMHEDGPSLTPEHKLAGRVAMRLIDIQRVMVLSEKLNARVKELLPPEISSRNHGIIISQGD